MFYKLVVSAVELMEKFLFSQIFYFLNFFVRKIIFDMLIYFIFTTFNDCFPVYC